MDVFNCCKKTQTENYEINHGPLQWLRISHIFSLTVQVFALVLRRCDRVDQLPSLHMVVAIRK